MKKSDYRIWYSTESFAKYVIEHTDLDTKNYVKERIIESDAKSNNFHKMPDHIKKILYLDAPDLIVERITAEGFEPIFSIEESKEAGTGHNSFQRFARLAASVENNVPAIYIYPEATIISRTTKKNKTKTWDKINPLVFKALEEVMTIYEIPALLFYFPTFFSSYPDPYLAPNQNNKGRKHDIKYSSCPDSRDGEMKKMFEVINEIIKEVDRLGAIEGRKILLKNFKIKEIKSWMSNEYLKKGGTLNASPLEATTIVDTSYLVKYLEKFSGKGTVGELIKSRKKSVIYQIDGGFRGDPYPGALAAIDYLKCRKNKTFEDREYNLILCFGLIGIDKNNKQITVDNNPKTKKSTILSFVKDVIGSEKRNLLSKDFTKLKKHEIPRYYMQVRYGSTYSKVKHIRVFSYFADSIIFPDGALWRDA